MASLLEVVDEPAQERNSSIGIRPGIYIAGRPLECRPAQRRFRRQLVDGFGELDV